MQIDDRLLKQITETKYLSAENAWRYRTILRFFYLQYEKMKHWMYKEEVFNELKKHEYFLEYNMDMCKQDLDTLAEWGNLIPAQDTSKATTVEEFKNKQFRYQLSEYSVEIERMTIRLENLKVESASLEPSLLERLKNELKRFKDIVDEDSSIIGMWWSSLYADFRRLNQNYQDYIRDLNSLKAEEMMRTREFLVFKDKFIDYLRNFIKGLQQNAYAIEAILKNLDSQEEIKVLEKVFEYESSIPRLDNEVSLENIKENIFGRWESLKRWFLGEEGIDSEVSKLFDNTNEIIRKITRYASQIVEARNSAANRKEEYKKLCEMFLKVNSIDEANKLSSVVFGIFNTRHIKGNIIRETESINSSVYEEKPHEVIIKPRVRTYRETRGRSGIADNRENKRKVLEEIVKKRDEEKKIIDSYVKDNVIDFGKLPKIESHVRITLLRWLSKGNNSSNGEGKTEDGRKYRILLPDKNKYCTLESEDGSLNMPHYIIKFTQENAL